MIDIPPTTNIEAKSAAHIVLDDFAQVVDGRLVVAAECPRAGEQSRYCFARVEGPDPYRFKVIVSRVSDGFEVRARGVA